MLQASGWMIVLISNSLSNHKWVHTWLYSASPCASSVTTCDWIGLIFYQHLCHAGSPQEDTPASPGEGGVHPGQVAISSQGWLILTDNNAQSHIHTHGQFRLTLCIYSCVAFLFAKTKCMFLFTEAASLSLQALWWRITEECNSPVQHCSVAHEIPQRPPCLSASCPFNHKTNVSLHAHLYSFIRDS